MRKVALNISPRSQTPTHDQSSRRTRPLARRLPTRPGRRQRKPRRHPVSGQLKLPGFDALNDIGNQIPPIPSPIHPNVSIGHVHLKVADLERALGFYCGVLGFQLTQRYGTAAAFIAAGGYHHHLGLNTWESLGGSPPPAGTTGLFHLAILYPTRATLADALQRLMAAGIALDGASDHGVSQALYLRDPDQNGVEL